MKGSRQKGSVGEREVAKLLGAWWSAVEPDTKFVKTPLSGGWGGPELRAGFRASGDLMTTAKRFPFAVEVKRREKGWTYEHFSRGEPCAVWKWWWQAQEQADEMGCEPMLWLRQNRRPWLIAVRAALAARWPIPPAFGWTDRVPPMRVNQGTWSPAVFYARAPAGMPVAGLLDTPAEVVCATLVPAAEGPTRRSAER